MMNDTEQEQPCVSNKEVKQNSHVERILNGSITQKLVFSLFGLGIITVIVFWAFMKPQADKPGNISLTMPSEIKADEEEKIGSLKILKKEHESIKRLLESILIRIDERAAGQLKNNTLVKSGFQDIAESIKQLNEMISKQGEGYKDLSRQVNESRSRLAVIAEDVNSLKAAKHKATARKKHRPVKKPPFVIDAIDVWDGVSYVAISQSEQVSFLKVGDQQSGWILTDIDYIKGQVSFRGIAGNVYSATIQR